MITPDRAIALYHLRMNPNNHKQATGTLLDCEGRRCALGVIAEAFNLPLHTDFYNVLNTVAYNTLSSKLGPAYMYIHSLNDCYQVSYSDIADFMEELWETGDSFDAVRERRGIKRRAR